MVRPRAKDLTERELQVMHVFWQQEAATAQEARDQLNEDGLDLAYTTVANLIRILVEKGFLETTNEQRPFLYRAVRSFHDVSQSFVGDLVNRVFQGSREQLLVQLFGGTKKLSKAERALLKKILKEKD